jgi:hypothetical protein
MEPDIFRAIAALLRTENLLCDTRGVVVEQQLGMFMYMLSHNASNDDAVDAMEELTNGEKAIVAEVFKNDMNMQMFKKQKNLNVRLIWLRRKIRYGYRHCLPSILKIILNVCLILLFGTCSRLASVCVRKTMGQVCSFPCFHASV